MRCARALIPILLSLAACSDVTTLQLQLVTEPAALVSALEELGVDASGEVLAVIGQGKLDCERLGPVGGAPTVDGLFQVCVELHTRRLSDDTTTVTSSCHDADGAISGDELQETLAGQALVLGDPPLPRDPDLLHVVRLLGYREPEQRALVTCGVSAPLGAEPPASGQLPVYLLCVPARPAQEQQAFQIFQRTCAEDNLTSLFPLEAPAE